MINKKVAEIFIPTNISKKRVKNYSMLLFFPKNVLIHSYNYLVIFLFFKKTENMLTISE